MAPALPDLETKLWPHQIAAYEFAFPREGALLAHGMGSGKTASAIALTLGRKHKRTLVVCPSSVISVWPQQFRTHSADRFLVVPLIDGDTKKRAEIARKAMRQARGRPVVVVTNYEGVWRAGLQPFLKEYNPDFLICDESHRAKSPAGKGSKYLAILARKIPYRLALSGTPMPHSPLDVWAQFRILNPSIFGPSFTLFRSRYAVMGGYENREVKRFINMEEFNRKLYSITHRVKSEDVLSLPEAIHQQIPVTLGGAARRAYNDLEDTLRTDIEAGTVKAANALSRLLRLQQCTSGFLPVDGVTQQIDTAKRDALADFLEDLPADEKVVVFARFVNDLAQARHVAEKAGRLSFELSGKENTLDSWKRSRAGSLLAVQIQSGGLGVSMVEARYVVYYSLGFNNGDYEQSLARVRRPGQDRTVHYRYLIAEDTIDEKVIRVLQKRQDLVEGVLSLFQRKEVA